jgi:hypothetical protein
MYDLTRFPAGSFWPQPPRRQGDLDGRTQGQAFHRGYITPSIIQVLPGESGSVAISLSQQLGRPRHVERDPAGFALGQPPCLHRLCIAAAQANPDGHLAVGIADDVAARQSLNDDTRDRSSRVTGTVCAGRLVPRAGDGRKSVPGRERPDEDVGIRRPPAGRLHFSHQTALSPLRPSPRAYQSRHGNRTPGDAAACREGNPSLSTTYPAPIAVSVRGASHVLQEMATQASGQLSSGPPRRRKKHRGG